jgi:hypothetical protein
MARTRKPENETEEESTIRRNHEKVANGATRSEKTSWNRKMENMVKLLATLKPIEDQILELMEQKQPIQDEVADLRATMVAECTHPFEYLVTQEDHIICKFCNRRMIVVDD